jgi:ferrous iron transport protein A
MGMLIEKEITLNSMKTGESGTVIKIDGGHHMVERLSALGIRPGKRVIKVSSMFMKGPVTIQIDEAQVAIGYRMAGRIIIELD